MVAGACRPRAPPPASGSASRRRRAGGTTAKLMASIAATDWLANVAPPSYVQATDVTVAAPVRTPAAAAASARIDAVTPPALERTMLPLAGSWYVNTVVAANVAPAGYALAAAVGVADTAPAPAAAACARTTPSATPVAISATASTATTAMAMRCCRTPEAAALAAGEVLAPATEGAPAPLAPPTAMGRMFAFVRIRGDAAEKPSVATRAAVREDGARCLVSEGVVSERPAASSPEGRIRTAAAVRDPASGFACVTSTDGARAKRAVSCRSAVVGGRAREATSALSCRPATPRRASARALAAVDEAVRTSRGDDTPAAPDDRPRKFEDDMAEK